MRLITARGLLTMGLLGLSACSSQHPYLKTVEHIDLDRYLGTWYEIARNPAPFQEGCVATTATYSRDARGRIQIVNRCRTGSLNGPLREAKGRARVADPKTNAKLRVTFFWPFYGHYWILGLGDDYDWALVGEPARRYVWILARSPQMDSALLAEIVSQLPAMGYDPDNLIITTQPVIP